MLVFFFFNDTATTEIYTLSLHDALPIWGTRRSSRDASWGGTRATSPASRPPVRRSTSPTASSTISPTGSSPSCACTWRCPRCEPSSRRRPERIARRRPSRGRSVLGTPPDPGPEEGERVELAVDHPLLERDDPVVGEVDALRADLAAALGDVAVAEPELVLRRGPAIDDVERVHVELGQPDEIGRAHV